MGDCNIHHAKWLRYSNGNSAEGELMKRICDEHSLKQLVTKPTRGDYLLDLALSDLEKCKIEVVDRIADHCGIIAKVPLPCPVALRFIRDVWHFKGAAWNNLRCALRACNWARLGKGSVDSAVNFFLDLLTAKCEEFIPRSKLVLEKATHPWLDSICAQAIRDKNEAVGSDRYEVVEARCAEILNERHQAYISRLKEKLANLSKNDRQWWRLNQELINKKSRVSSIPPLKDDQGTWHVNSVDKANLLASKINAKCALPPDVEDQYVAWPEHRQNDFFAIRTRCTFRYLQELDVFSATGPDKIAARILKELAEVIALPITLLCRRILYEACWPERWRVHHIVPIYKKASVYDAGNYRGVHLTPIISKVVERVIGQPLISYLETHAFGNAQWVFREKSNS